MAAKSDIRRRWFGAICLAAALLMVVAGQTLLHDRLRDVAFIVYWLACFVFTMLAILVAFLDASTLQRRAREQQRDLIESTIKDVIRDKELKGKTDGRKGRD